MTVTSGFVAAQLERVLDMQSKHDALFGVRSAEIERTNVGLRHVEKKLKAVLAEIERRLDRLETSP